MAIGAGLSAAALAAGKLGGASALTKGALLSGAGTAIGALPDIIPSKYERDQKKRLREMQRKQEMGALGLTDRERAAIESQMRQTRQQAQQFANAERARLTQPTAQPQMALLGQQMADEGRQRLEADLASQILGIDLQRQQQQQQEIKDLEAAQAQYKRARAEGLTAPFQSAAEAYVGQMALERLLQQASQAEVEQAKQVATATENAKAAAQKALATQDSQTIMENIVAPSLGLSSEDLALFGSYKPNAFVMPDVINMQEAVLDDNMTFKKPTDTTVQDMMTAFITGRGM
jgi:hypothetical protein